MALKRFHKGDVYDISTYRIWLVNFNQSTHGKFLVMGTKDDAVLAAKNLEKTVMKGYPYAPKIKEVTGKMV